MTAPDLSGLAVVGAGTFNPAIIHPRWLAGKGLIPEELAAAATEQGSSHPFVVAPQLTVFVADWLSVQVTPEQAVFSTVDQARELDLRDFARGVFELLPETPVDALGVNSDTHFHTKSVDDWHAFGDLFLPKDFWEPMFESGSWLEREDGKRVGMRSMTVEVTRDDPELPGFLRIELAPSVRIIPNGVYVGLNGHFQLRRGELRSDAGVAADVLMKQWDEIRGLETSVVSRLLEAI